WKVTTNTGATTEVTGGDTVDFINGENIAITNTGRNITIGTAKTVSFDKVQLVVLLSIKQMVLMPAVKKLKVLPMLPLPILQ
ncbi:Hep/Hag repeat protein, partial [human gut metagenome]